MELWPVNSPLQKRRRKEEETETKKTLNNTNLWLKPLIIYGWLTIWHRSQIAHHFLSSLLHCKVLYRSQFNIFSFKNTALTWSVACKNSTSNEVCTYLEHLIDQMHWTWRWIKTRSISASQCLVSFDKMEGSGWCSQITNKVVGDWREQNNELSS